MAETDQKGRLAEELRRIAESGQVSHAYLLEGENREELLAAAKEFAGKLITSPADVLFPEHEKPNLIGVDDIRTGINETVYIRPYGSTRKVYVVRDAEKMNPQAQNALLKTLEEPPEYVVILLLAESAGAFLPTILSRCVKLSMYSEGESEEADEAGKEAKELMREILSRAEEMNTKDMLELVNRVVKAKEYFSIMLEELRASLRDLLVLKAGGEKALLLFPENAAALMPLSRRLSYPGIGRILREADQTQRKMTANVNPELSVELLILTIREEAQKRKQ